MGLSHHVKKVYKMNDNSVAKIHIFWGDSNRETIHTWVKITLPFLHIPKQVWEIMFLSTEQGANMIMLENNCLIFQNISVSNRNDFGIYKISKWPLAWCVFEVHQMV